MIGMLSIGCQVIWLAPTDFCCAAQTWIYAGRYPDYMYSCYVEDCANIFHRVTEKILILNILIKDGVKVAKFVSFDPSLRRLHSRSCGASFPLLAAYLHLHRCCSNLSAFSSEVCSLTLFCFLLCYYRNLNFAQLLISEWWLNLWYDQQPTNPRLR